MFKLRLALLAVTILGMQSVALAASAEPAPAETRKADKARNKPLQRCDQLSDKAELDCLEKARARIVEARRKREAAGKDGERAGAKSAAKAPEVDAPAAKAADKR